MSTRKVQQVITGQATTDGAGVDLVRVIGQPALMDLDPFLLLDAFRSDDPDDYIAGFPPHPHRGFETVTYLLNGRMRHKDNAGNEGVIEPGGIQWMTAGRGIVHSEMPEQQDGLLEGFQLWINLPGEHKMDKPAYQEHDAANIPTESRDGATVKVISGVTAQGTTGPVSQPLTEPVYFDVILQPGARFDESLATDHNAFVYVIQGELELEDNAEDQLRLGRDQLAVLGKGDLVSLLAGDQESRFLLIAGKPLNESVARAGPFVMNTAPELRQAFIDYQSGNF
ncbi:MAG: pirin family protein [Gammaproteobacteria bacterium]|nr:pirin family protein [Gammaproteobacteria bacterium]MDH3857705.1 pirin family protein [Gammaproteobacteria bacterium]